MPHVRLPSGSQVLCSWDVWKAQPNRFLVENTVPLVAAGSLLALLPSLAPHSPQKIPSTDIRTYLATHAPLQLGKSQDAFSSCKLTLTCKKGNNQ